MGAILVRKQSSSFTKPVAWLNNNIITAAQHLLKSQTSCGGLQPPTVGQSLGYDIMWKEFVQVLHDGHNHWLTVSNIDASSRNELFIYKASRLLVHTPETKFLPVVLPGEEDCSEIRRCPKAE